MMLVNVTVTIKYQTDVPDDPEVYEGADTPESRMDKECEYLEEGGDYLFQALAYIPHATNVEISPAAELRGT